MRNVSFKMIQYNVLTVVASYLKKAGLTVKVQIEICHLQFNKAVDSYTMHVHKVMNY